MTTVILVCAPAELPSSATYDDVTDKVLNG